MRLSLFPSALALLVTASTMPAVAAMNTDPDWPCIQRKVPELSMGQIWTGRDLPASAAKWQDDEAVAEVVADVAPRRVDLPDAQEEIRTFAAGLPDDRKAEQLLALVQGLFDHMNHERSQVIAGIGRYARGQVAMAESLRHEASEVDKLRADPNVSQSEIMMRNDRLMFRTRIFEERVQSLTYVCEVPTLIEQRLYQLAKTIAEVLPPQ
jgi:hypothetical protein